MIGLKRDGHPPVPASRMPAGHPAGALVFLAALLTAALPDAAGAHAADTLAADTLAADTLAAVRASHTLSCGVVTEPADYTKADTHGHLTAFARELCRAVTAAALGAAGTPKILGQPDEAAGERALAAHRIDVLFGATPDAARARAWHVSFGRPIFFDGQGLLTEHATGIETLRDLGARPVCFIGGTDAEDRLHDAADRQGLHLTWFPFEEMGEMEAALVTGRCVAESEDVSVLANARAHFHARTGDFTIPALRLTLDPYAPVTRQDDPVWTAFVDAVGAALVQAEASGVTRGNLDQMAAAGDTTVRTLLGSRAGLGWGYGLPDDWARSAIATVGNYGEIFDRTLGQDSPLGLDRGPNRPAAAGGLLWTGPYK